MLAAASNSVRVRGNCSDPMPTHVCLCVVCAALSEKKRMYNRLLLTSRPPHLSVDVSNGQDVTRTCWASKHRALTEIEMPVKLTHAACIKTYKFQFMTGVISGTELRLKAVQNQQLTHKLWRLQQLHLFTKRPATTLLLHSMNGLSCSVGVLTQASRTVAATSMRMQLTGSDAHKSP